MRLEDRPYLHMVAQRLQSYAQCCSATAVFGPLHGSRSPHPHRQVQRGLRLEASSIAVEFSDNISFGSNIEGILFYQDSWDFKPSGAPITYTCFYNDDNPRTISVDFFRQGLHECEIEDSPFCSFITKDTTNIPCPYIFSEETNSGSGTWQNVSTASAYGKIHKETSSDEVTIVVEPIGKKVHFSVEGHCENRSINSMGAFTYVSAAALRAEVYRVDFGPSQILLYDESNHSRPIASFKPIKPMAALHESEKCSAYLEELEL